MNRSSLRTAFVLLGSLLLSSPGALAEDDPTQQEQYKNGLLPTGTYSGPQNVNLQNGNFIVSVPLFSLPGAPGTIWGWS